MLNEHNNSNVTLRSREPDARSKNSKENNVTILPHSDLIVSWQDEISNKIIIK